MERNKKIEILKNHRFSKVRRPSRHFYCALCRAPRQMAYAPRLRSSQILQILVLSLTLTLGLWPLMEWKILFAFPFIFAAYEGVNKMLYRRELSCPYCGFDPTWYRRDVKKARSKVQTFWEPGLPNQPQDKVEDGKNLS